MIKKTKEIYIVTSPFMTNINSFSNISPSLKIPQIMSQIQFSSAHLLQKVLRLHVYATKLGTEEL